MKRARFELRSPQAAAIAAAILAAGGAIFIAVHRAPSPNSPQKAQVELSDQHGSNEGHAQDEDHAHGEDEVVELTAEQLQASGITTVSLGRGGGVEARLAGQVTPMPDARAIVATPVSGTVEQLLIAPGQAVKAGQTLAVLISGDAAAVRAEVDAASAAAEAASQAFQRNQSLFEQGVVARQEVESSRAQALSAQAAVRAAGARARSLGQPSSSGRLRIISPNSGIVTSVQVGPGGYVSQGAVVAEVVNPQRVELQFSAPAGLSTAARPGSLIRVTAPAGEFEATITGVAAGAGSQGGYTLIRARPVAGVALPIGLTVSGVLVTERNDATLTVPAEALQTVDGRSVVFVRDEHGFRATPVLPGRQVSGRIEILKGLTGDEQVAAANAFLLKSQLAKGEAGHQH